MTKEYEIKHEPVVSDDIYSQEITNDDGKIITPRKLLSKGVKKDKYNIYYYRDGELEAKEFHSTDGVDGEVRKGYTLIKK